MKRRGAPVSERAARDELFRDAAAVAGAFKAFRPASEVLLNVRAVPTIWPQFDFATRVGGFPIERFSLLHGGSASGKTYFAIGLMLSFLVHGHPVLFIDAERTTPHTWLKKAMGQHAYHPLFRAMKPTSYEQTRVDVRDFLQTVKRLRDAGKLPPDTSALIVLDSLRKLILKDEHKVVMQEVKEASMGEVKVNNRLAQTKARAIASWLDELVILLDETRTAMVAIAREMVDPNNTNPRSIKAGTNVKTQGGSAPFYDASLDLRSQLLKRYGKKVGSGEEARLVAFGDRHLMSITKTKVSGKGEDYRASCLFHISNGSLVPEGFDRGRDLVELARRFDVVTGTQSLKFGQRSWRSEDRLVEYLAGNPDTHAAIERECRALFKSKLEETRP